VVYLDLAKPPDIFDLPRADVAVVCAAITGVTACERDPAGTSLVNVTSTRRIIESLMDRGTFVIFLSTDRVFDGSSPWRRTDEFPCPTSEYGRQKAEIERVVLAGGRSGSVLRLTKVLAAPVALFARWAAALQAGSPIEAFNDLVMSPLPLTSAVKLLVAMCRHRREGIFHLSGDRDITYAEVALRLARHCMCPPALVRAIPTPWRESALPRPPAHTTLSVERTRAVFGMASPDVDATLEELFTRHRGLPNRA
jgi:dTDP-4-dehydrorhamnose reductase